MTEYLLKPDEVCRMLRCSRRTLNRVVDDGLLRPFRLRGLVRFRQEDVVALLEAFGEEEVAAKCRCEGGECTCAD